MHAPFLDRPSLKPKMLVLLFLAALPSLVAAQAQPRAAPLPEGIEKRSVTIWSDGTRMAGDLYLPKDLKPDDKLPAVVFCNGVGRAAEILRQRHTRGIPRHTRHRTLRCLRREVSGSFGHGVGLAQRALKKLQIMAITGFFRWQPLSRLTRLY